MIANVQPKLIRSSFGSQGGIDIWYMDMDSIDYRSLRPILASQEIRRADRLKNPVASLCSVISRGMLRIVLANYLDIHPKDVQISYLEYGKPFLACSIKQSLFFNVTHSRELLVIAVSQTSEIGIDLEWIDPNLNPARTASIAFSREEYFFLESHGFSHSHFYRVWTLKESVMKAAGHGFSYPSNKFSVISSKDNSIVPMVSGEITKNQACFLHPIVFFPGYIGAVAEISHFPNPASI